MNWLLVWMMVNARRIKRIEGRLFIDRQMQILSSINTSDTFDWIWPCVWCAMWHLGLRDCSCCDTSSLSRVRPFGICKTNKLQLCVRCICGAFSGSFCDRLSQHSFEMARLDGQSSSMSGMMSGQISIKLGMDFYSPKRMVYNRVCKRLIFCHDSCTNVSPKQHLK